MTPSRIGHGLLKKMLQNLSANLSVNLSAKRLTRPSTKPIAKFVVNIATVGLSSTLIAIAPAMAPMSHPLLAQTLSEEVLNMERRLEREFEDYFGENLADVTLDPADIAQTLNEIGAKTNTTPAVMWVMPKHDHLRLVLTLPSGETITRNLHEVPARTLRSVVQDFRQDVSNPNRLGSMVAARQLHQWIIEPLEAEYLQAEGIDTILFCLGQGVRGIPLTALYDGDQFLVERYNLTRIPAFNLIQTDYNPLGDRQILAMGASEFADHAPLPAVPTELSTILWALDIGQILTNGQTFLNGEFTFSKLQEWIATESFDVVHLATHAEFRPGNPDQSYIQFWDRRLSLDQADNVDWNSPPLELLVLSACRTALGDDTAELGFAGLALKAGVKSALASLWYVSDFGTLALMSDFYQHLGETTTKAAALRTAQLNMLNGTIRVDGNQLILSKGAIDLPPELHNSGLDDLSHPFYWASFTMISSPW